MANEQAVGTWLDNVSAVDGHLLELINFAGSDGWSAFWWTYTDKLTWVPLAVAAAWWLLRRGGWRHALLLAVCVALLFVLSDAVLAGTIKPLVARLRPTHDPAIMDRLTIYNDYRGGRYSFPSNHASNGFAIATLLWLLLRSRWTALSAFAWACGSCYSRLYLGVHYPTDILAGALLGSLIGLLIFYIYRFAYNYLISAWNLPPFGTFYEHKEAWPIVMTLLVTVVAIAVWAMLL